MHCLSPLERNSGRKLRTYHPTPINRSTENWLILHCHYYKGDAELAALFTYYKRTIIVEGKGELTAPLSSPIHPFFIRIHFIRITRLRFRKFTIIFKNHTLVSLLRQNEDLLYNYLYSSRRFIGVSQTDKTSEMRVTLYVAFQSHHKFLRFRLARAIFSIIASLNAAMLFLEVLRGLK